MLELGFALQVGGALLALEAVRQFLRRFGRGHAELGSVVRRVAHAVARLFSNTFERCSSEPAGSGAGRSHTLIGS